MTKPECVHALTAAARQILAFMINYSAKEMPYMNTHLPADLEQFVPAKVRSGRFSSSDEAITAALRLLRQQEEAEETRVLEGIRQGLDDMRAGRTQPLAEVFADIRRDLNLPHGS
jgi:putative addiction module CopG family antidote